jgi:hypothetical protein
MKLEKHIARQMAFSWATFGPGERRKGVADHISKEIKNEILCDTVDPQEAATEWVDVVILGLDGLWRALHAAGVPWHMIPGQITAMIEAKQAKNEQRTWPDWRTADPEKAIEHDRSTDDLAD